LQKLSSPAHEDEMKALHQKMLKELAQTCQTEDESKYSHIATMIKGLRFVLQQIQVCIFMPSILSCSWLTYVYSDSTLQNIILVISDNENFPI
jgi:hypothetical protein